MLINLIASFSFSFSLPFIGIPVGFLIPMEGEDINMAESEVIFAKIKNEINKGDHMYAFREEPDRTDLIKFFKTLESQTSLNARKLQSNH